VQGCQTLQAGDLISLGKQGAEFIFEYQGSTPVHHARPLNIQPSESLHVSQVLPVFSMGQDLRWKKLMIPGAITVLFVVLMFNYVGTNDVGFMLLLGLFLAIAGYYIIYQLCGKSKPWWVLLIAALATMVLLKFPDLNSNQMGDVFDLFAVVFIRILPGGIEAKDFPTLFISMLFGAGLIEELLKAIPILAALYIGLRLQSPWRERIGVWEPLDGILLGAASAVGFTLVETLLIYVPRQIQEGGALAGFMLLIPRILGSIAGHMAYSGYFGYFIGLSVLKPSKRWQLLGIGYLTAATIHALWNSVTALTPHNLFTATLLQAAAGILAFAFLIAAILKARQLSPTRAQNFATQYRSPNSP
jgi:RsiW-degrading membrane proteinase PrsW (M82 family)